MNAPFALGSEVISLVDLRDPGEIARIEGFVADLRGSVFHRPAWSLAVEQGTGQRALGLVAEKCGSLHGWMPLTEVHSPIFGRALVSSGFAVGGGPLSEKHATSVALCHAAQEVASRRSCASIEIRSGGAPETWRTWNDTHCGFERELADNDEAELLLVPRKQRAEIRKSLKLDFVVEAGSSKRDRDAHYAVYSASVRNLGTPVFPRSLFGAMLDRFGADADILTIRHAGEPVASVLSFYHQGTVLPFWGGGTYAARHLRANERMYYELMLHARRRKGCGRFDFGRSKTNSGPYSYKKNWGFEPHPLIYAGWTVPGETARDIDPTSEAYLRKIDLWKRLPLSMANRVGPFIAKGLA
uniref:FemAB family XrtA/PEP-CTERM system-associated protein n=1 Tax=Parerythrobacter lutipelagi TaxID=1964208 RepID=UPI0010F7332A|nr:FemAB family XrtA/PEP-CTERM system-associated protein [Parerythrobacter lutipelagi]